MADCIRLARKGFTGLCDLHYRRRLKTGDVGEVESHRRGRIGIAPCSVEGCPRKYYAKNLCSMHYNRTRLAGSAGEPGEAELRRKPVDADTVWRWTDPKTGYVYLTLPRGRQRKIMEHRLVMEQVLGRPLQPFENVHHRNGVRDDNRPENLEMWTKPQPTGQRPEDLVAWIVHYYPELVDAEMRAHRREQATGQLRLVV